MSFIDGYMRFFLGIPGQMAFEFAKHYEYFIYAFGMVYGLFITVAAYNYRAILPRRSERFIKERIRHIKATQQDINTEELAHRVVGEWKQMIDALPKYMCIMGKRDYWVVWPDGEKYAEKLNVNHLYVKELCSRL